MGLLDTGGFDDPGTLGLLSFGARMSNAPGGFMRALGPSVLGALNDRGQAKQDIAKQAQEQLRMQLLQQQMMDAQAKRAEDAKARANLEAFRAKFQSPMMDASQAALSGGGGPTNANAAQMRPVDPRQQMMFEAMQLGQVSPMDYLQSMAPKPEETKVVGDALVGIGPQGVRELYKGVKTPQEDDFIRNMRAAGIPPESPQGQALVRQWLQKNASHAPPVSVSYGAPVAGVDDNGKPVFFQPEKTGGKPAIIPGVAPAPAKLGEGAAKQVAGIDSLSEAIDAYVGELAKWKKADALSPDKRAAMGTAYNNMMLQAKEAYNLGVLNGPDYTILQSVVRDPTNALSTFVSNEALVKQALTLKAMMSRTKRAVVGAKAHANDKPSGGGSDVDAALQKYVK